MALRATRPPTAPASALYLDFLTAQAEAEIARLPRLLHYAQSSVTHSAEWTWLQLQNAVDVTQCMRIEAQHVHAATLTALEHAHAPFDRRYDERAFRY